MVRNFCFIILSSCTLLMLNVALAHEQNNVEICKSIASLKGVVHMMESISSTLTDMISSAKFRTTSVEGDLCSRHNFVENARAGNENNSNSDHCVPAQMDCKSLYELGFKESGPYRIWPSFLNRSITVYCDMETDGGGWIVIQRRGDFGKPRLNFYEEWSTYKKGFGDIEKEFWLGNDIIFALTNAAPTVLRIDLEDFTGDKRYAKYQKFFIRSELEKYRISFGDYEGNAGDSLREHNEMEFGTKDRGNHCPRDFKGAWWYAIKKCHDSNLNGLYHEGGNHTSFADGINWRHFRDYHYSMKSVEMKIRRCGC